MKKSLLLYIACILILFICFTREKKYSLQLTEPEVNMLWQVVDQSAAPHTQVKAVQDLIQKQFAAQVDTTKKK